MIKNYRRKSRLVKKGRPGKLAIREVTHDFMLDINEYRKVADINKYQPIRESHWDLDHLDYSTYYFYEHHITLDHAKISVEMENYEDYVRSLEYNTKKESEYQYACTVMYWMTFDLVMSFMLVERPRVVRSNIGELYDIVYSIATGMFRRFIKKGKMRNRSSGSFSGLLAVSYGPLYSRYTEERDRGLPPVPNPDDTLFDVEMQSAVNLANGEVNRLYENPEVALFSYEEIYKGIGTKAIDRLLNDLPWTEDSIEYTLLRRSLVISILSGRTVCYGLPKSYTNYIDTLLGMLDLYVKLVLSDLTEDNRDVLKRPDLYDGDITQLNSRMEYTIDLYIKYRRR